MSPRPHGSVGDQTSITARTRPRFGGAELASPRGGDGDDLYVRSYKGAEGGWFRGTQVRHEGRIRAGGVDQDVTFADVTDPAVNDQVDAAYRAKYSSYGASYIDPMLAPAARSTTLRLVPR
jgi:hypothetical protein